MDRRAVAAVAAVMQLLAEGGPEEGTRPAPAGRGRHFPGPSPWALYGRQSIMRAGEAMRARLRRGRGIGG